MMRVIDKMIKGFSNSNANNKQLGGNHKTANSGDSLPVRAYQLKIDGWVNAIQTYSDYFIRY